MSKETEFNSLSDILKYFTRLNRNALDILAAMAKSIYAESDSINVKNIDANGITRTFQIPSYNYLNKKLQEAERNIQKLYAIREKETNNPIFGQVLVSEPNEIGEITVPVEFYSKPNFFLESLLNPQLYVKIDLTDYVQNSTREIISKRLLLNLDDDAKLSFFETNYNKVNDLNYDNVIEELEVEGIKYTVDEDIWQLPAIELKSSGTFDILSMSSEVIKHSTYSYVRKYMFSKLTYTDNTQNGVKNTKNLVPGDILLTEDGDTEYEVIEVNQDTYEVTLAQKTGYDILTLGTDVLRIASEPKGSRIFHIPISYSENQIIFIKAIDPYFHTTSSQWGSGFGFKSEELYIQTENGQISFNKYYSDMTKDFGRLLQDLIKNKVLISSVSEGIVDSQSAEIPSVYITETLSTDPSTPELNEDNFKIVNLADNLQTNTDTERLESTLSEKETLQAEKTAIEDNISELTTQVETELNSTSPNEVLITELQSKITEKEVEKSEVVEKISTVLEDLKTQYNDGATEVLKDIPAVVGGLDIDITSNTEIPYYMTTFEYRYRYLDSDKNPVHSYTFALTNGVLNTSAWNYWVGSPLYRQQLSDGTWTIETNMENPDHFSFNEIKFEISNVNPAYIELQTRQHWQNNPTDLVQVTEWSSSIFLDYSKYTSKYTGRTYDAIKKELVDYETQKEYYNLNNTIVQLNKRISTIEATSLNTNTNSISVYKQTYAITMTDINNLYFFLNETPVNNQVTLKLATGEYISPNDYTVINNKIYWEAVSTLGSLFEDGTVVIVEYLINAV